MTFPGDTKDYQLRLKVRRGSPIGLSYCISSSATWAINAEDPMVLEISMMGKDVIWSFGEAIIGQSEYRVGQHQWYSEILTNRLQVTLCP